VGAGGRGAWGAAGRFHRDPCAPAPKEGHDGYFAASLAGFDIDDDATAAVGEEATAGTSALFLLTIDAVQTEVEEEPGALDAELVSERPRGRRGEAPGAVLGVSMPACAPGAGRP
jgi:uncharacterized membrane protein